MNERPAVDIACTLERGDASGRAREWREVGRHARERHVEEGRVTAIYPRSETLRGRLVRLIEAESECCPFLGFQIHEEGESIRVELTYPPGAEALVDQVIAAR